MKKLRRKSINDYIFDVPINIGQTIILYKIKKNSIDGIDRINKEFLCVLSNNLKPKNVTTKIRESILSMYNDNITQSVMLIYCVVVWYKIAVYNLKKNGNSNFEKSLLNFDKQTLLDNFNNYDKCYFGNNDKNDLDMFVLHEQLKLLNTLKLRISLQKNENMFNKLKDIITTTIDNTIFLNIINDDFTIDNSFLQKWEYYPVDSLFSQIVNNLNSEVDKDLYKEIVGKEFQYFNLIKNADVDFNSIKHIKIKKDGKLRAVYSATQAIDKLALIYISKRLKKIFKISYPNREKIMEICIDLIDSLPNLDNYTIFKFDFENFFDSVEIKKVLNEYIIKSNIFTYEKEIIFKLSKKFKYCVQGLPISNALIEIISQKFDESIKTVFVNDGLLIYRRYVDDCILIFNRKLSKKYIEDFVYKCLIDVFGTGVKLSDSKTFYQTKLDNSTSFDYLGYLFNKCKYKDKKNNNIFYYEFGISSKKLSKYKKELDKIFSEFKTNNNQLLLLRRIQYYNSRIVFCNYNGSKYSDYNIWDVRGITNSYKMLRRYIIYDNSNYYTNTQANTIKQNKKSKTTIHRKIEFNTYCFLKYYIKELRNSLNGCVPKFLRGKGYINHTLWCGFIKNKSIVFQPNIGWSSKYLNQRLVELGFLKNNLSYYEKTKAYYNLLNK